VLSNRKAVRLESRHQLFHCLKTGFQEKKSHRNKSGLLASNRLGRYIIYGIHWGRTGRASIAASSTIDTDQMGNHISGLPVDVWGKNAWFSLLGIS
jgi:hypothetical protein